MYNAQNNSWLGFWAMTMGEKNRCQDERCQAVAVVAGDAVSSLETREFLRRADQGCQVGVVGGEAPDETVPVAQDPENSLPSPCIPHGYDQVRLQFMGISNKEVSNSTQSQWFGGNERRSIHWGDVSNMEGLDAKKIWTPCVCDGKSPSLGLESRPSFNRWLAEAVGWFFPGKSKDLAIQTSSTRVASYIFRRMARWLSGCCAREASAGSSWPWSPCWCRGRRRDTPRPWRGRRIAWRRCRHDMMMGW